MPSENPFLIGTTKELSTGTSTAAIIEGFLHGWHGTIVVLVIGGAIVAIIVHHVEHKRKHALKAKGVQNYGLVRVY